jgi:dihydrodipicolinate synthase/N-acetylneuraminate lyase
MNMAKQTTEEVRGIWAALPLSWDEHDRLDEDVYRANAERIARAGVHGVYTTGSTGEFYALDVREFRRMVDIVDEVCGRLAVPLQIGCCATATRETLALVEYAAAKPHVGGVQVALPYWMELIDREVLSFFRDVSRAAPQASLIHYNVPRAKRFLLGPDYVRVREAASGLVGVKFTMAGTNFDSLQVAVRLNPGISFLVGENLLASGMLVGARGSCSSMVFTDPSFMLSFYERAAAGRWEEAMAMQSIVSQFYGDLFPFVTGRGEGLIDPVFDKGLAIASGCLAGSPRTRAPYLGWSDETVAAVRSWLREHYPQFLHPDVRGG